jgi:large subunit ribosomal protein L9
MSLTFHARAGEDGKLFGSVTNADVADRANGSGSLDFELDKRVVAMDEPLKSLGVFEVNVHLHMEVDAVIEVRIEREEG